jgi:hypothetical protein
MMDQFLFELIFWCSSNGFHESFYLSISASLRQRTSKITWKQNLMGSTPVVCAMMCVLCVSKYLRVFRVWFVSLCTAALEVNFFVDE